MTILKGVALPNGTPLEAVHTCLLNPKSVAMGQLNGERDLLTNEC
jgi:hypothetical protein